MITRKFPPGSDWIYLKIYSGVKTSDVILQETIHPLICHLKEQGFIDCWFFIRYNDPKSHIRFRLKLINNQNYNKVFYKINKIFQQYIESGEISNILLDTYTREIERYGETTIESAETLFNKSSDLVLNFLEYDDEEKIITSLFYIDKVLSELKLSIFEKLEWISLFNTSFKKEFHADKALNSQLDKKFRVFKPSYLDFIHSEEYTEIRNIIISNIKDSHFMYENIIQCQTKHINVVSLSSFFQSIFHMHINRIFTSNQRSFEMIIYDYMYRYYKTLRACLKNE